MERLSTMEEVIMEEEEEEYSDNENLSTERHNTTPQYTLSLSDGYSSEDETTNYYLDFDEMIGKDLVIFSYMKPERLHLFRPSSLDTSGTLCKFAKDTLSYNHHYHRLAFLFPNELFPMEIGDVVTLKPSTSLLVLPKTMCKVTVVVEEMNKIFEVETDLIHHVFTVKQMIEAEHGFPLHQQELLFEGRCLENKSRLYQCNLRSQSVLHLQLLLQYNMVVTVNTFWKTTYNLFVDPCMQVGELMEIVYKRCVSREVYEEGQSMKSDFLIPRHILILLGKGGRTLNPGSILGSYNVQDGDVLLLTTVGRHHKIGLTTIEVNLNDGRAARVVVSQFDTWSVVGFHIHGVIKEAVDKLCLFYNNNSVDLSKAVGTAINIDSNIEIRPPESKRRRKPPVPKEMSVVVYLGSSVTETIKCSPEETVGFIKEQLKEMSIPNIKSYLVATQHTTLNDSTQLKKLVGMGETSLKVTLKLETFPVSFQLPNNLPVSLNIQVNQTVESVLKKIERKSEETFETHKLLLAGCMFSEYPETPAYDSELGIGTNLHMVPREDWSFSVHSDTHVTKLEIEETIAAHEIKRKIWDTENLPASCIASLETFLKWHLSLVSVKGDQKTVPLKRLQTKQFRQTFEAQMPDSSQLQTLPRLPHGSPRTLNEHSQTVSKVGNTDISLSKKTVQFADTVPRPRAARSQRKVGSVHNPMAEMSSQRTRSRYASDYKQQSDEAILSLPPVSKQNPLSILAVPTKNPLRNPAVPPQTNGKLQQDSAQIDLTKDSQTSKEDSHYTPWTYVS